MRTLVLLVAAATVAACSRDLATAPAPAATDAAATASGDPTTGSSSGFRGWRPDGALRALRRLPDNLRLTDAQRAQISALVQRFEQATKSDREAMQALMKRVHAARQAGATQEQIRQLLAQGEPIRQRLAQAGERLKNAIAGVLTADQKAWLAEDARAQRAACEAAKLTDAQKAQIKSLVQAFAQAHRNDSDEQRRAARQELRAQIEAVLTPEQRASECRRGVWRFLGAFGHAGDQSSP
jgi:Spy/CpxP family protein refolding chaperone